jgi:hypothetical protein
VRDGFKILLLLIFWFHVDLISTCVALSSLFSFLSFLSVLPVVLPFKISVGIGKELLSEHSQHQSVWGFSLRISFLVVWVRR